MPQQTFWDHLDVLRSVVVRILLVTVGCAVVAFIFKDPLFSVVLAPKSPDFITYRFLEEASASVGVPFDSSFSVQLINTGLAQQFLIHMKTALCAGFLCAFPYILYQLFEFISPALYYKEKRYATRIVTSGYVMFMLGIALSYFIIFPMTFRFLGTYQVNCDVTNMITLDSYMSVLIMLCLCMGIVCEMPVLAWLLSKAGVITSGMLRKYRHHAIVVILTAAAIITPTSDIFTLLLVSLPMWALYELSILITRLSSPAPSVSASEC